MRQLLLAILCLFSLSALLAAELFVIGDSESDLGRDFIASLASNAPRDAIFAANESGFVVLDVEDQGYLNLSEGPRLMLSVVLGAGENTEEWVGRTNGPGMRNYYHLRTVIVLLDEADSANSIQTAVSKTFQELQNFFVRLQDMQFNDYLGTQLVSELQSYAASMVQLYKTPVNQGGLGRRVDNSFARRLAEYYGWDINSLSYRAGDNKLYKIEHASSELVTLSATLTGRGYNNGPLYFIDISLPDCQISTRRNPIYGE